VSRDRFYVLDWFAVEGQSAPVGSLGRSDTVRAFYVKDAVTRRTQAILIGNGPVSRPARKTAETIARTLNEQHGPLDYDPRMPAPSRHWEDNPGE
jgi:hypothetical protein